MTTTNTGNSMNNTQLVLELIIELMPLVDKYGAELVQEVTTMFHNPNSLTPSQVAANITKVLADAATKDQQIIAETA